MTLKIHILHLCFAVLLAGLPAAHAVDEGTTEATVQAAEDPASPDSPPAEETVAEPDPDMIDWDALNIRDPWQERRVPTVQAPQGANAPGTSWSRDDRSNGSSGITVKQSLFPAWDANAGVDMDVAKLSAPVTSSVTLPDRLQSDRQLLNSSAAAWMTAKAPGIAFLWDQTAVEARMTPFQDSRFGTSMSKSLPFWGDQFLLTLQHSYVVTQHGTLTGLGAAADYGRDLNLERTARLKINNMGMTLLAGQNLSTANDHWLSRIGAEQQLFGGISVTGSINQTIDGGSSKTISAGFRRTW